MTREHNVLPLVLHIRDQIDEVFLRYVGPIAAELCEEEFNQWRTEGQVGPTALHRYISRLAKHIPNDTPRRAFVGDASKRIQVGNGGKT